MEGQRLRLDAAGGTAQPWDELAGFSGLSLREGTTYALVLDAAASTPVEVRVAVQLEDPPCTRLLDRGIALAPSTNQFAFRFAAFLTTSRGQTTIQLGGHDRGFTVWLGNVALTVDGRG